MSNVGKEVLTYFINIHFICIDSWLNKAAYFMKMSIIRTSLGAFIFLFFFISVIYVQQ